MKIKFLDDAFRGLKYLIRRRRARAELAARTVTPKPHPLRTPLIVSLTSYPPRFDKLALTLQGILKQTMAADRTILWIAEEDMDALPVSVRDLADDGLEIRSCPNLRSYKKILPALAEAPDATIITADDDVYYPPHWLEDIVTAHHDSGAPVVCVRGHYVQLQEDGRPKPYGDWTMNHSAPTRSGLIFPTGVSGILYAPGCFAAGVTDWETASALCPTADDVWLYWMHRLNGVEAYKFGEYHRILEWERDPVDSLKTTNAAGGNDQQIAAMIDRFGWPAP
ncbi:glycosyltransferase [uncultured Tateyamaria sp.]|uniref:glycosyltransferase n=1 Tax=uncultured Tateyamaria sp. TaxID=455651 RepID=UPI002620D6C9|nr:glycosyltransferase [uncultured Tateyamaria sp.]